MMGRAHGRTHVRACMHMQARPQGHRGWRVAARRRVTCSAASSSWCSSVPLPSSSTSVNHSWMMRCRRMCVCMRMQVRERVRASGQQSAVVLRATCRCTDRSTTSYGTVLTCTTAGSLGGGRLLPCTLHHARLAAVRSSVLTCACRVACRTHTPRARTHVGGVAPEAAVPLPLQSPTRITPWCACPGAASTLAW
jgi:hypothetical protein